MYSNSNSLALGFIYKQPNKDLDIYELTINYNKSQNYSSWKIIFKINNSFNYS